MPSFPVLSTGAVTQYPSQKLTRLATDVVRFVDGAEQRSPALGVPVRRWVINLQDINEGELAALDALFRDRQGAFGEFSFTDPWDGTAYPHCTLVEDQMAVTLLGPSKAQTRLIVEEVL